MVLPTAQRSLFVAPDFGLDDHYSEKSGSIKPLRRRPQRTSLQRRQSRFWQRYWNYGSHRKSTQEEEGVNGDEVSIAGTLTEPIKIQTRWLPIVSGIICPFSYTIYSRAFAQKSVLLEIPGLTAIWYVRLADSNSTVLETQPNPVILDVALAISMALGAGANVALVVRFLERYCYKSTILAMTCLTIHDIINIVVVTIFGVIHRVDDGFDYSSAFWLTVASTIASAACNGTLIYDFFRTKDFRLHGSGLTNKQRQLVISFMVTICYLGVGALIFNQIMNIPFESALYFVIVSCATVGFGDIVPNNLAARIMTFFYTFSGILLIGLTVAQAREVLVESFALAYRHRRRLLVSKAKERRARKKAEIKRRLQLTQEKDGSLADVDSVPILVSSARGGASRVRLVNTAKPSSGISDGKAWVKSVLVRFKLMKTDEEKKKDKLSKEIDRMETASLADSDGYKHLKQRIHQEQKREFRVKLVSALVLFFIFWFVGAAVFVQTEQWEYFDSLYFCFVFFTTIGYGDYAPSSQAGRSFFIAWSLFGIANLTLLFSVLTESWSLKYKSSIEKSKVRKALKLFQMPTTSPSKQKTNESTDPQIDKGMQPTAESGGTPPHQNVADLPQQLIDAAKGFDEHAKFLMHGFNGDMPQNLKALMDAEHDPVKLQRIQLELGVSAAAEAHEVLFLHSYYMTLDKLVDHADQVKEELARLQAENTLLHEQVDKLQSAFRVGNNRMRTLIRRDTMSSDWSATDDGMSDFSDYDSPLSPTTPRVASALIALPGMSDAERIAIAYSRGHPLSIRTTGLANIEEGGTVDSPIQEGQSGPPPSAVPALAGFSPLRQNGPRHSAGSTPVRTVTWDDRGAAEATLMWR